ncbi:DUF3999 family protein [Mucilaginibacter aquatilis]|uniref:DUF3999 family protein n=1 Tax=Mucilaginibacter aquatilis TaxID=1517760 RepID=A0A6I4I5Y0_9SPHI|nr:DUF3999 family protein [Mucilaginibacter aquatilis]MVN90472.1 DUF3999 family protein [Mucilaginibacter aquatilis]
MKHLQVKVYAWLLLLLLNAFAAMAQQQHKYKAKLATIDTSRFYTIGIGPNLMALCRIDMADIRLSDERGKPVPYITGNSLPVKEETAYETLPAVKNPSPDTLTCYIAENTAKVSIRQLWIKLRNTAVTRTINILGSDDLQNWFAIKEHVLLDASSNAEDGVTEQLLNFPASTYRYIKIQVNDKKEAPIYILQAGIYLKQQSRPQYDQLPNPHFTQKNSADTTYVSINFDKPYRVDKLNLKFEGAKYYNRRVQVYSITGRIREWIGELNLSAANTGDLLFVAKSRKLELVIYNEDNPALTLQAVKAYQLQQSIVAYLEKGVKYTLLAGNPNAVAPRYDLQYFTDSIDHVLPAVGYSDITPYGSINSTKKPESTIPVWIIWVAGAAALLILLLLTLKMTREIGKGNK